LPWALLLAGVATGALPPAPPSAVIVTKQIPAGTITE